LFKEYCDLTEILGLIHLLTKSEGMQIMSLFMKWMHNVFTPFFLLFLNVVLVSSCANGSDPGLLNMDGDVAEAEIIEPDGDLEGEIIIDGDEEPECAGCMINGTCLPAGAEDSENLCGICNPEKNKSGWSARVGTFECRPSAGECDLAEYCDGYNLACPTDIFKEVDIRCGDSATECSDTDTCDGAGVCLANDFDANTTCGDDGDDCVNQDMCDGAGGCVDKGFVASDTNCGDAATECSAQDTCDGAGVCLENHLEFNTTCGDAATECSAQDTCNGRGVCMRNDLGTDTSCGITDECSKQDMCDGNGSCEDKGWAETGKACGDGDQCLNGACVDCWDDSGCTDLEWGDHSDACADRVCGDNSTCVFSNETDGTACGDNDQCVAGVCADCYNESGCSDIDWGNSVEGCAYPICNDNNTCELHKLWSGYSCGDNLENQCDDGVCLDCVDEDGCKDLPWSGRDDQCSSRTCGDDNTCGFTDEADGTACLWDDQCVAGACVDCFDEAGCVDLYWDGREEECSNRVCGADNTCEFADEADGTVCNDDDQCDTGVCKDCFNADGCSDYQQDESQCTDLSCVDNACKDVANDNNLCDLGHACSEDRCENGWCVVETVTSGCLINDQCIAEGESEDADGCIICDPSDSNRRWSWNNGAICAVTSPGTTCADNVCLNGECIFTPNNDYTCEDEFGCTDTICYDGGCYAVEVNTGCFMANEEACFPEGAMKADSGDDSCYTCDTDRTTFGWAYRYFESCDDADLCTFDDACQYDFETYESSCSGTTYSCNDHGSCNGDGTCACDTGFGGDYCDQCSDTYEGYPNCQPAIQPMIKVAAGLMHTCGISNNGVAKCWGYNGAMQVGHDTALFFQSTPIGVDNLSSGVLDFALGNSHSCALTDTGSVKCWGTNQDGQLGDGTVETRNAPVDVAGLNSGVVKVASRYHSSCALKDNGSVKCWGKNNYGQLGDGTTENRMEPVDVIGLDSGVADIGVGTNHACALSDSGGVKCWGSNHSGAVGNDSTQNQLSPVDVVGLTSGVSSIFIGRFTSCAILDDNSVKCWGGNYYGQLGDGTNESKKVPVDIAILGTSVVSIVSGDSHTCALFAGGAVKCWGNNDSGQLGDGTTDSSLVPVDVLRLDSGVTEITTAEKHSCALTSGGYAKCWGANVFGYLGDGTANQANSPVSVKNYEL